MLFVAVISSRWSCGILCYLVGRFRRFLEGSGRGFEPLLVGLEAEEPVPVTHIPLPETILAVVSTLMNAVPRTDAKNVIRL